ALGGDALRDEVGLHRLRALLRELLVVGGLAHVVGVAADLQLHVGVVLQHLHGAIEHGVGALQDLRRAGLEVDALDDAGELLDLGGHLVGAAVLVLIVVLGLGIVRALVDGVGDAVAVVVGIGAAV